MQSLSELEVHLRRCLQGRNSVQSKACVGQQLQQPHVGGSTEVHQHGELSLDWGTACKAACKPPLQALLRDSPRGSPLPSALSGKQQTSHEQRRLQPPLVLPSPPQGGKPFEQQPLTLHAKIERLVKNRILQQMVRPSSSPDCNSITSRFRLRNHITMTEDFQRVGSYQRAIRIRCGNAGRAQGTQGPLVIEIGTGPFALLSVNAAREGARRVVAFEAERRSSNSAAAFVKALGYAQQIKVIRAYSTDLTPEHFTVPSGNDGGSFGEASEGGSAGGGGQIPGTAGGGVRPVFEELLFEEAMEEQQQQRRLLDFAVEKDGLLAGLCITNEVELAPEPPRIFLLRLLAAAALPAAAHVLRELADVVTARARHPWRLPQLHPCSCFVESGAACCSMVFAATAALRWLLLFPEGSDSSRGREGEAATAAEGGQAFCWSRPPDEKASRKAARYVQGRSQSRSLSASLGATSSGHDTHGRVFKGELASDTTASPAANSTSSSSSSEQPSAESLNECSTANSASVSEIVNEPIKETLKEEGRRQSTRESACQSFNACEAPQGALSTLKACPRISVGGTYSGDGAKSKQRRIEASKKKEALKASPVLPRDSREARRSDEGRCELPEQLGKAATGEGEQPHEQERVSRIRALKEKLQQQSRYSRPRYLFSVRVYRGSVILGEEAIDVPIEEQCPDAPPDAAGGG
ncbi:protamine p1 [Cyclospora cayetanensis]|uniref:Protamine p1 n=1 Tax=Cyclospora cayetanensis TaxID=88456 RepID=A0A1D3D7I2_9EIME|nr:protamine p1 [Cyclospora cayetanensis]